MTLYSNPLSIVLLLLGHCIALQNNIYTQTMSTHCNRTNSQHIQPLYFLPFRSISAFAALFQLRYPLCNLKNPIKIPGHGQDIIPDTCYLVIHVSPLSRARREIRYTVETVHTIEHGRHGQGSNMANHPRCQGNGPFTAGLHPHRRSRTINHRQTLHKPYLRIWKGDLWKSWYCTQRQLIPFVRLVLASERKNCYATMPWLSAVKYLIYCQCWFFRFCDTFALCKNRD